MWHYIQLYTVDKLIRMRINIWFIHLQTQSGGILSQTPFTQVRILLPVRANPLSQV